MFGGFRFVIFGPIDVAVPLVLAEFAADRGKGAFGDADFVREELDRILVALVAGFAVLGGEFADIIGGLGIQTPEGIADRTGFHHD